MADGSVIIKVEMKTDGVQAGVNEIRAGCGRAAAAAEKTGRSMTRAMAVGTRSMRTCGESVRRVGMSCGRLRDGMGVLTAENGRSSAALEQMRASLNNVRTGLSAAFAPVVTEAAPLLTKLCTLVARAAGYVTGFFSVLSGKGRYKNAVKAQDAITKSVAGTGKAAKETARNLSGLDELNIWREEKDTGFGGGGYGGGGIEPEDMQIGGTSDFIVRLRDILFQWDNLNPELIAEKILTGLCAVAGGILGWKLGGPVGGLVGLTLGALLGVKLSQVTFNGDGTINKSEGGRLVLLAVMGLLGGIAGAMIGGPAGAAIGFLIGAGASVLIGKALFSGGEKQNGSDTVKRILAVLGAVIGGILGFVIGGPKGAAIGFTIGAGISILLQNAEAEADGGIAKWVRKKIFAPIKKGLKAAGVLAVTVAVSMVKKIGQWAEDAWEAMQLGGTNRTATIRANVVNATAGVASTVKAVWDAVNTRGATLTATAVNATSGVLSTVSAAWSAIVNKTSTLTAKAVDNSTGILSGVQSVWSSIWDRSATLTAQAVDHSTGVLSGVQSAWSSIWDRTSTLTTQAVDYSTGVLGGVQSIWSAIVNKTATLTAKAVNSNSGTLTNLKSAWDSIKSKTVTLTAKILTSAASAIKKLLGLSTGGIYKNGRWEPIEGYASGGNPRSARLFYANENGMPELVGRIGSSTAVMNNGQIVASVAAGVYQAVAAAFGQLGGWFRAMSASLGEIPPAIELLSAMPRQIPQPVMATGTVIPPKAVYADGPVQGLADAVSGLREALDRQDRDRSGTGREPVYNVNLNVDGRTLLQAVLSQGRLRQMQSGDNPFMALMGG